MERPLQCVQLSSGQSLSFPPLLQCQMPGLGQSWGERTTPGWPTPQMSRVFMLCRMARL